MRAIQTILLILSILLSVGLGLRNRELSRSVKDLQGSISELSAAPVVVQAAAVQEWRTERVVVEEGKATSVEKAGEEVEIPEDVLEKAVAAREEQRRKAREAEREARRLAWENQTLEEREARQAEFRRAMEERAAERLGEFVERTKLDEVQERNVELIIADLDGRVRAVAETWAETIRASGTFSPAARMQLVNELTGLALDSYGWMDESLPESWREADGDFNILQMMGADALSPLMDATREVGLHPGSMGSVMGLMMGGWRGPRGNGVGRGGNGGGWSPPPMPSVGAANNASGRGQGPQAW